MTLRYQACVERTNRVIAGLLYGASVVLVGSGLFFGLFGWLNDGWSAGMKIVLLTASFGAAFAGAGAAFRAAAAAFARRDRRRLWWQAGAILVSYVLFGLAATASSWLDRW